jgi:hypothetical protein
MSARGTGDNRMKEGPDAARQPVQEGQVVYDKRGGSAAAKGDLQELKDIQAGEGTTSDKLKRAGEALKEPGAKGPER